MTARGGVDVTVVVPTYQGERYLEACLSSIAEQDLDGVEVLVLDDASTDGTVEVARSFAERLGALRVVVNDERMGAVGNVNRGIDLARGRWVKPVFQDDLLEPGGLDALRRARQRGVPVVVGGRRYLYEGDVPEFRREACEHLIETSLCRRFGSGLLPRREVASAVATQVAGGYPQVNQVGEPVAVLLHRRSVLRAGGFDPGYVQLWDYEVLLRLGVAHGLSLVDETVATFRVHGESETARNFAEDAFRINVVDRLRLHVACATSPAYREVRRAATTLEPPADLVAGARGVADAARALVAALPDDQVAAATALVDEVAAPVPELPPGPSPSRSKAEARQSTMVEELRAGPWLGLSAVPMDLGPADGAALPSEAEPEPGAEVGAEVPAENLAEDGGTPGPLEGAGGAPVDEAAAAPVDGEGAAAPVPDPGAEAPPVDTPVAAGPRPRSRARSVLRGPLRALRIVRKVARSLRTSQWWGHMLGPVVAFALLQIGWRGVAPGEGAGRILALVACAVSLAAYGYVVNDASDVELDRRVGKSNSMARFPVPVRVAIILVLALAGAVPWFIVPLGRWAFVALLGIYLLPLLYSAYPVRLKERHVLGPMADASNAFILPALFTIGLYAPLGDPAGPGWLMVVGALLWTVGFGLRAIVKHLVDDAWSDRSSGTVTLVVLIGERRGQWLLRRVLFPVELVGLALLVATVATWSWPTALAGLAVAATFHGLRVTGLIDRRHGTTTLEQGWWMPWYQIWPALLLGIGLTASDPAHAWTLLIVLVVFGPRVRSAFGHVRQGARNEARRRVHERRARRAARG